MSVTVKTNLIIPEVLEGYINAKLTDNSVFLPIAEIDNTLVGNPGDTITVPKYAYIGDATVVAENGQITPTNLSASSVTKTVHKLAKAVSITDEARLSAYGDPMGEAGNQIVEAIDNAADNECLAELGSAPLCIGFIDDISSDHIVDALVLFGEDGDGEKALYLAPVDLGVLRKDADFINASEIATNMLMKGIKGEIWGCQLKDTNKLKGTSSERDAYIVKPGALKYIMKRGVMVETEREAEYQRDNIYGTVHGVPYLADESKVIKICLYKALQTVSTGVVTSVAGTTAQNDTILKITEPAPVNTKWVYKLGSADVTPTWGTAVTSYTDWTSSTTEIAASTSTKASVILVDSATDKPIKYTNVTLVKKA